MAFGLLNYTREISKAIPSLVILNTPYPMGGVMGGLVVTQDGRRTLVPSFEVREGYVLGEDTEVPAQKPPLTKEETFQANVEAITQQVHKLMAYAKDLKGSYGNPLMTIFREGDSLWVSVMISKA